jgi:hypothetical protein
MKMGSVERVPIEIPGVQVVGEFPIKRFLEIVYNAAAKQYGVKLTATVRPSAGNEWAAEPRKERLADG